MKFRYSDLEKQIDQYSNRENPQEIQKEFEELIALFKSGKENGSIYKDSGYLLSAFKSPLDSTLQPFSIYLPKDFNPSKPYDLLVALHGSGVDEVSFTKVAGRNYGNKNAIIIGPRGRDLST